MLTAAACGAFIDATATIGDRDAAKSELVV
jgi:hypothetical protein